MKTTLGLVLIFFSVALHAKDEIWTPEVKFKLDDASYVETLHWVSGVSYAYTEMADEMSKAKIYCTEMVGSKDVLDILNMAFLNKTINTDQASLVIKHALPKVFPCK